MYSNKENVNILTALLVVHGIRHAVVCPGSRNSPIVHNLNECPDIQCWPVTDERSAGFYALGLALLNEEPVAVCVTSGTALLNLAPAVAEAYYQHVPLVVISADRPPQWIDQLDGQTLPQPDALGHFVKKAVTLIEPHNDEGHWYCNRLVNEALIDVYGREKQPVHINVPISEPLFQFDVAQLPIERGVGRAQGKVNHQDIALGDWSPLREFWRAKRPMVIVGQNRLFSLNDISTLSKHAVILHESIGCHEGTSHFDEVLYAMDNSDELLPDFVIYGGGTIVSKRLKSFLRKAKNAYFWECSQDGQLHDTFMNVDGVIEGKIDDVLELFNDYLEDISYYEEAYDEKLGTLSDTSEFVACWETLLLKAHTLADQYVPAYSQMAAVKHFEYVVGLLDCSPAVHFGNSSAVRLANIYSKGFNYCNRGVNGIEGSLSTAAGFSCVTDVKVCCVIGDLSFFYDQNALWNQNLRGNLRILLMNNGKGGIFNMLKGLEQSPARDKYVAAEHHTSAAGICQQNNVGYMKAENMEEMQYGINRLLQAESDRPMLLEVFTDAAEDERVFRDYYKAIKDIKI
jgi:2-succinyl-5-enolpyruvyl-6-hydroxy-3-cyclohexene-1-carboxylate synthase